MKNKLILLTLLLLVAGSMAACSSASSGGQRTPMPMLAPATMPAPAGAGKLAAMADKGHCLVRAVDLLGAWVAAGAKEKDPFDFTDVNGKACKATYADDVSPLFYESNLWFTGALACKTCHSSDLKYSYAQMDLSSYAGIIAGERRQTPDAKGADLLGGGNWEQAKLRQVLITKYMPLGRPADSPEKGPLVPAGTPK